MKTIKELGAALRSRKIGAVELAREHIKNIKERDDSVGAFITVTEDAAIAAAEKAQKSLDSGTATPLTGIPFAVKDNICTKDILTTCASKMLSNFAPPYDADVIEALQESGYVLLGKTNMDEFAMGGSTVNSAFHVTRNPRGCLSGSDSLVPGGSSGGSAAAVAAGFAPAALGSDTGGSIRQPAAFCEVTGFKPTYGAVSRYGLVAFGSSLDQIGPIANTPEDCAIIMNCISRSDKRDGTSKISREKDIPDYTAKIGKGVKGLKIAVPPEFFEAGPVTGNSDEHIKTAVLSAVSKLKDAGAVILDGDAVSMGNALEYAVPAYYLLSSAEAASNLSRYDGLRYGVAGEGRTYDEMVADCRDKGFGAEVKRRILLGNYALSSGYYDAYYRKALALRQEIKRIYDGILSRADVIITPTSPVLPWELEGKMSQDPVASYMADICTVTVNVAGLPAASVPCGNMTGLSVIGRAYFDADVLGVCDEVYRVLGNITEATA